MSRRDSGASSIASRRSRRSNTGGEGDSQRSKEAKFFEECQAAYVAVLDDTHDAITSRSQLSSVLHQSGRNPSQKTLDKYWTAKTKKLTYDEFCDIMRKEKPTTTSDLLNAFKKIDINGDGFITHDELSRVLTQRGEKMTSKEVETMIAEADDDGDRKLNYNEFCKMLMSTASKCRQLSKEKIDKKMKTERKTKEKAQPASKLGKDTSPTPHPRKRASINKTLPPVAKVAPKATEPRNLKSWNQTHRKGCCLFEHGKLVSHQYALEVSTSTALWLTVKPMNLHPETATDGPLPDIRVYLVRQRDDGTLGDLVAFTNLKSQQKYCLNQDLRAGTYRLLPMTTGCRFKPRERQPKSKAQLTKKDGEDYAILKPFRNALADIFELVDLDGNGTLSREEFNIFQLRTSGESVDDDAWEVVEENFELKKGELTRKGFMDLNQMEANDLEGDTDDLWETLHSMGFADDLKLDEALPFVIDVFTDKCKSHIKALPLQSGGSALEMAVCDSVMRSSEDRIKIKEADDAVMHCLAGDAIFTVVVENKSSSKFSLRMDCGKSSNCSSSRPDLDHTLVIPSRAAVVGHHLMPVKESEDWTVKCTETVIT
ncbi:EF-hand calcium-binding domain-containing protein 7-like [Patiria miniata]|uniref:EF-hand domain-containing protein n=1 Tax=Patiria miniata TaxID=46514 RepID=A0A913Z9X9_PATMI|nr:EF-hand calcium-binding domain-containing protein 7-like [Patiria miniata]XP_038048433.1 EF-hand calcium-binding domain-containing protein 7-like [Patiria miniata]XP_038048434.1 EF-hand calcium-binding domain-containing protein 7-like [Patiria miniata]XP_038048435.1 EF-hand calcium-binding domain-containing protein 7-like [Patiria miniata]